MTAFVRIVALSIDSGAAGYYTTDMKDILNEIEMEVNAQLNKWGVQSHSNGTGQPYDGVTADTARSICDWAAKQGTLTWRHILDEEVKEAFAESDYFKLREELIQVAAVCCSWVQALDRTKQDNQTESVGNVEKLEEEKVKCHS